MEFVLQAFFLGSGERRHHSSGKVCNNSQKLARQARHTPLSARPWSLLAPWQARVEWRGRGRALQGLLHLGGVYVRNTYM